MLFFSSQGDRGCPRTALDFGGLLVARLFAVGFCGGVFLWVVPRSSWSKGPEFGEVLPAPAQLTCFANAWRQFCFAEPALAEHLLKGMQKPLSLPLNIKAIA